MLSFQASTVGRASQFLRYIYLKKMCLLCQIAISLFLIFPLLVEAQQSKLTSEYDKCIEQAGAIDPKILECMSDEYSRQDKRLNSAYKKLLAKQTPKRKKELQEVQRLWVKYTEANCDFYYNPDGGTSARQFANQCSIDARANRAVELESFPN